MFSGSAE